MDWCDAGFVFCVVLFLGAFVLLLWSLGDEQ